jgi:glycosyltransferase involved in cell wall biosynthesis
VAQKPLKVAIVHDWLVGGGAERVVYELHQMFPDAPIYTSYTTDEWRKRLNGKVVTGWLQHFGKLRKFMVLGRIWWFSHLDLSAYDLVISSSGNGEAFSVKTPKTTTHICYCHTPTHYYWRHYDQYIARPGFGILDPLARIGLRLLVGPLRKWDLKASKRPDYYIANSNHIKDDIKRYYDRDAAVVHPPVDVERFKDVPQNNREGFVTMGRMAAAKRVDIPVAACNELGVALKVIGRGPDLSRLKNLAGPTITFPENVSDAQMPAQLASAQAFLFASFDDFGISPVEALAAGTPIIAYKAGGALDYVIPGQTGLFYDEQTAESMIDAIKTFDPKTYDHQEIITFAQNFSPKMFHKKMETFIATHVHKA